MRRVCALHGLQGISAGAGGFRGDSMNLRPLLLGVSLLAGTAPMVAFAQQTTPQQFDESDLGFTPAQMADFAGQPNVVYATVPVQPALVPSQQSYDPAQLGRPDLNQPQ